LLTLRHLLVVLILLLLTNGILADPGPDRLQSAAARIDLLALVDPTRDRLKGEVEMTKGALSMQSRWFITALRLPYLPSEQYDLELELNRIEGKDGIGIVLPLARQRQVALVLGGYPELGGLDGLNYVDGKNLAENGTGSSSCLENAHKIALNIQVRPGEISYRYPCRSGEQGKVYRISGDRLSIDDRAGDPDQRALALYQVKGRSSFSKIRLTDYGQGRQIQGRP
jgi:hypothetical protein